MKWQEEKPGFDTSVHSWKPCTPERFAKLMHGYTAYCADDFGHAGMSMTACKLDHDTVATIFYRPKTFPAHTGVSTPALMTVATEGRVITFERIASYDYPGLPEVTGVQPPAPHPRINVIGVREAMIYARAFEMPARPDEHGGPRDVWYESPPAGDGFVWGSRALFDGDRNTTGWSAPFQMSGRMSRK